MTRTAVAARCPWCERSFRVGEARLFWSHVYSEHEASAEDALFELAGRIEELQLRLRRVEDAVRLGERSPPPLASSLGLGAGPPRVAAAPWRLEEDDEATRNRPESYF